MTLRRWLGARSSPTFEGMNARARQLRDELLQLSADDRALIAAELTASLHAGEDDATPEEIEKAWARSTHRAKDMKRASSRLLGERSA